MQQHCANGRHHVAWCQRHIRHTRLAGVAAAAGKSPWSRSEGDSKRGGAAGRGSSGSNGGGGGRGGSKPKKQPPSSKPKGSGGSSSASSKQRAAGAAAQGFAPASAAAKAPAPTYKVTPPLTPQLLDALSAWDVMPSPLWGTFTGHCEGTWLGQYTAFTPWGGDPEPVWADASGAYLTHAFVRVSERRQLVPAEQLAEGGALGGAALGGGSGGGGGGPAAAGGTLGAGEELDLLVRSTLRSASISSLIGGTAAAAAAAGDGATAAASSSTSTSTSTGGTAAAADEEQEALAYNVGGCVVFNGGSYSLGPQDIELPLLDEDAAADFAAAAADAAAAASSGNPSSSADDDGEAAGGDGDDLLSLLPFSTVVVEQALVAGGDTRLRLVATLKLRQPPGQEMDIEVARLLLYKEHWYTDGTAGSTDAARSSNSSSSGGGGSSSAQPAKLLQLLPSHRFDLPITQLKNRPQPAHLSGTWNVFVVAATPAVEENPDTLQEETVMLYTSREERQHWHVPDITSSAAPSAAADAAAAAAAGGSSCSNGGSGDDDSGGSWWLPGGAVVTLRMVDNSSSGSNGSSSSGSGGGRRHRGLLVGLHMLDGDGSSCLFVEREHAADGSLVEVRQGTAVKGAWAGGRM